MVEPEGNQSYFARVASSSETGKSRRKNATVDIRKFSIAVAERDNVLSPSALFSSFKIMSTYSAPASQLLSATQIGRRQV